MLALIRWSEEPPTEERSHQDNTDEVDAQSPPGLCITAGADSVKSCQGIDAKRQDVQTPPQEQISRLALMPAR